MNDKTFAELYCEQRGIPRERYTEAVLSESLYPHARMLAPLIKFLRPRHFSADTEFVGCVGMLRRFRDYTFESEEFSHHPDNRGFWRVTANLRVSSRRMRRLLRRTLHPEIAVREKADDHSSVPFGGPADPSPTPPQSLNERAP